MARSLVFGVCVLVFAALAAGCSSDLTPRPGLTPAKQQLMARTQRFDVAKSAAASALADVEMCESIVLVGGSLESLTFAAARARDSALTFARTEDGSLLPTVTAELLFATQDYVTSCNVWRRDNKLAEQLWLTNTLPGKSIAYFSDSERYRLLWVRAAYTLGRARVALREARP